MFTKEFLVLLLTRAIKTFAQTAAALIAVDATTSIIDLDWPYILGVGATAAVLSILTTIAEYGLADTDKRVEMAGPDDQPALRGSARAAKTPEQREADKIDALLNEGEITETQWEGLDSSLAMLADGKGNFNKRTSTLWGQALKIATGCRKCQ